LEGRIQNERTNGRMKENTNEFSGV
jgi:hypothetical protein